MTENKETIPIAKEKEMNKEKSIPLNVPPFVEEKKVYISQKEIPKLKRDLFLQISKVISNGEYNN